jgi:hypothetical protein
MGLFILKNLRDVFEFSKTSIQKSGLKMPQKFGAFYTEKSPGRFCVKTKIMGRFFFRDVFFRTKLKNVPTKIRLKMPQKFGSFYTEKSPGRF